MSIKSKFLAVAATLMLAGGAAAAAALPANAETPSCGQTCVDLFPSSNTQLILDDESLAQTTGTPLTVSVPGTSNPGEDFTVASEETVAKYVQAGVISAPVALHYGCEVGVDSGSCTPTETDDLAFELEYSPFGAPTGECVGIASAAVDGTVVSLQPCGVGPDTIWIVDSSQSISSSYVPLITATDTDFSTPYVLTFTSGGASLVTETLQQNSADQVSADQLWSERTGTVVPLAVTTTSLHAATGGRPYSASLTASGGVTPYSWSVTSGSLPPGLTLDSSTGQISGTPDVAGTYQFTVTVSDDESPPMTISQSFSISVSGPVIARLRPDRGPSFGFTPVVITGTGLSCPARDRSCKVTVTFGGKRALVVLVRAGEIAALDPPGKGTVTVTVTVGGVSSQATAATTFTYERFL